jgi:hypothetical protein
MTRSSSSNRIQDLSHDGSGTTGVIERSGVGADEEDEEGGGGGGEGEGEGRDDDKNDVLDTGVEDSAGADNNVVVVEVVVAFFLDFGFEVEEVEDGGERVDSTAAVTTCASTFDFGVDVFLEEGADFVAIGFAVVVTSPFTFFVVVVPKFREKAVSTFFNVNKDLSDLNIFIYSTNISQQITQSI